MQAPYIPTLDQANPPFLATKDSQRHGFVRARRSPSASFFSPSSVLGRGTLRDKKGLAGESNALRYVNEPCFSLSLHSRPYLFAPLGHFSYTNFAPEKTHARFPQQCDRLISFDSLMYRNHFFRKAVQFFSHYRILINFFVIFGFSSKRKQFSSSFIYQRDRVKKNLRAEQKMNADGIVELDFSPGLLNDIGRKLNNFQHTGALHEKPYTNVL